MNRTQKLKMNTTASLLNRFAIIISGLILPRFILLYFGSEANGMVASINQFLSVIVFLDLGVGSVVKSVLYKPLAKNDNKQISLVFNGAKKYFRRIAYVLLLYVVGLILFYPLIIDSSFGYVSTIFLIIALAISSFGQYYFGIVNELLLSADQRGYIQFGSEIVVVILNLVVSVLLIINGAPIQTVKLVSGLIYLIRPIYLSYYVNENYNLDYDIEVTEDPLPQKWSGMGQHIAYTIQKNTDVIVLTLLSTLENISIYSIYNMVVTAVRLLFTSLTSGITPFFGDLLANDDRDLLEDYFSKIEWLLHTTVVFLYGMTAVLINKFALLYTAGIDDVNYDVPFFSIVLVLAYTIYSIRSPYRMLIFAAGHFRETQISSFIEAGINIVVSLILVNRLGLVGVAIGTLVSMSYQTLYLVLYLSKNIIFRSVKLFVRHIIVDAIIFGAMMLVGITILEFIVIISIIDWLIVAIILGILFILISVAINFIFYKENLKYYLSKIIK